MHSESTSIYSQPILIHTHLNPMNWHCRYPPPHQRITSPRRTMRCAHIVLTHTNLMENPSNYTMNAKAAKQQPQRTIRHSRLSTAAFFYIYSFTNVVVVEEPCDILRCPLGMQNAPSKYRTQQRRSKRLLVSRCLSAGELYLEDSQPNIVK